MKKDLSYKTKLWGLWCVNWNDAYAFFNSKGNVDTKSKLKDKWYKDFMRMFE
jgi:hypothetical protein